MIKMPCSCSSFVNVRAWLFVIVKCSHEIYRYDYYHFNIFHYAKRNSFISSDLIFTTVLFLQIHFKYDFFELL